MSTHATCWDNLDIDLSAVPLSKEALWEVLQEQLLVHWVCGQLRNDTLPSGASRYHFAHS